MTNSIVQVELTTPEVAFVEAQVRSGACASPGAYLEGLVRKDMAERAQLRAAIVEGMNSGFGCIWTPELGAELLKKAKARHTQVA